MLGKEAIDEFREIIPKIIANDPETHERLDRVNCNIKLQLMEGDKTTFSLSEAESSRIVLVAAILCIPKDKYITLCQCYSLRTHKDLADTCRTSMRISGSLKADRTLGAVVYK